MRLLKMYPTSINEKYVDTIVNALKDGSIIILPTDTLYAIACDALNNRAIERICKIKDLDPNRSTLSIVCSDISQASDYAKIDNKAFKVLKDYLPGPYTFILPASTSLPKVFKGRKTVGVRIPDNPIAEALASALGNPLMTTSIDVDADAPFESVMPDSIAMRYGDSVDIIIDAGEGEIVPSTVVDITDSSQPEVLREGKGEW
ncbi:MAG: L-threonylcarbamoyladenylate synthase [Muribaculaceae bacterium]